MIELPAESDFMRKRLALVRCAEWFSKYNKTDHGAKAVEWYIATVEPNGDLFIHHGIDTAKLDDERKMIAEHNRRVDEFGDASSKPSPRTLATTTIEDGRKKAMLQRGGPSPLFRSDST